MKNNQFISPNKALYDRNVFLYTRRFFNKEEIEKGTQKYIEDETINNTKTIDLNYIKDSVYKSKKYHFFVPKKNKITLGGKKFYPEYLFEKTQIDKLNKLNNIFLKYKKHFEKKEFNENDIFNLLLNAGITASIKQIKFLFDLTDKKKNTISFAEILSYSMNNFFQQKYKLFRYNIKKKYPNSPIPIEFSDLVIKVCEAEIEIQNKKQEEKTLKENSQSIIGNIRLNLFSEDTIRRKVFREFTNSNSSYFIFAKYSKNANDSNKLSLSSIKSTIQNEMIINLKSNTRNTPRILSLSNQKNIRHQTMRASDQLFLAKSPPKTNDMLQKNSTTNFHIYDMNDFNDEIINSPSTKSYKIYPNGQSNYKDILKYHEKTLTNTKSKIKKLVKELKDTDSIGKKNLKRLKLVRSLETLYNYNPLLKENYIFFDSVDKKFKSIDKHVPEEAKIKKESINRLFADYEINKFRKKMFDKLENNLSEDGIKNANINLKNAIKTNNDKNNMSNNNFINSAYLKKYDINTIEEYPKKHRLNQKSRQNIIYNNINFNP